MVNAKRCKQTRSTVDILRKYGQLTDAIDISFVPSIGMDKVSHEKIPTNIEYKYIYNMHHIFLI